MTDELIKFETAKLAKEKRFKAECSHYYEQCLFGSLQSPGWKRSNLHSYLGVDTPDENACVLWEGFDDVIDDFLIKAPTQSLLQRWLREVHNINVWVELCGKLNGKNVYSWCLVSELVDEDAGDDLYWDTYEEAMELGLVEGLNLIK